MSWLSFLRFAQHSKIPTAVTRFHTSRPVFGSLRVNLLCSLSARSSSTLDINYLKNVSPSICNVVLQRSASTSEILPAKKPISSIEVPVPNPPKRPPNAYTLFCKESYGKAKESVSIEDQNPQKVMANLGKMWNSLPENEANMYKIKAKELQEKYKVAKAEWEARLSPLQEEALLHQKEEHSEALKKRKLKKVFKETEKPERVKRVLAINLMDVEDVDVPEGGNQKEKFTRQVQRKTELWNSLPENEKEALKEKAKLQNKNANVNYEKKLASWVQNMFDEHRMDIVTKPEAKVALEQLGMPSRNKAALQLFMMSELGKEKGVTVGTAKTIFDKLSNAQRETFSHQAMEDKEKYQQEWQDWMGKMESKGLKSYAEALLGKNRAKHTAEKVGRKSTSKGKKKKGRGKKKSTKKTPKKSST